MVINQDSMFVKMQQIAKDKELDNMRVKVGVDPNDLALPIFISIDDGMFGNWTKCIVVNILFIYVMFIWD